LFRHHPMPPWLSPPLKFLRFFLFIAHSLAKIRLITYLSRVLIIEITWLHDICVWHVPILIAMRALLFKKWCQRVRKLRSTCYLQKLTNTSRTTKKNRKSSQFHAPLNSRVACLRKYRMPVKTSSNLNSNRRKMTCKIFRWKHCYNYFS